MTCGVKEVNRRTCLSVCIFVHMYTELTNTAYTHVSFLLLFISSFKITVLHDETYIQRVPKEMYSYFKKGKNY